MSYCQVSDRAGVQIQDDFSICALNHSEQYEYYMLSMPYTRHFYCISVELCLQSDLTGVMLIVSPTRMFSLKALYPWCLAYSVIQ